MGSIDRASPIDLPDDVRDDRDRVLAAVAADDLNVVQPVGNVSAIVPSARPSVVTTAKPSSS